TAERTSLAPRHDSKRLPVPTGEGGNVGELPAQACLSQQRNRQFLIEVFSNDVLEQVCESLGFSFSGLAAGVATAGGKRIGKPTPVPHHETGKRGKRDRDGCGAGRCRREGERRTREVEQLHAGQEGKGNRLRDRVVSTQAAEHVERERLQRAKTLRIGHPRVRLR